MTAPFAPPADVSADVVTQLVTVGVTYEGGQFRVTPRGAESASRLVFAAATNAVSGFGKKLTSQYPSGWSALPFIAHNPADGCMIVVGTIQSSGDGFPGGKTLNVLYQFGVLLAADQMAHDVLPDASRRQRRRSCPLARRLLTCKENGRPPHRRPAIF